MSCYERERIPVFCHSSKCYIEIRKVKTKVLVEEAKAFDEDGIVLKTDVTIIASGNGPSPDPNLMHRIRSLRIQHIVCCWQLYREAKTFE
jgi:hypothetical protein